MAMASLLFMSMNVSICLLPNLDVGVIGPAVSLEMIWPISVGWGIVALWGLVVVLACAHALQVIVAFGGMVNADNAGNIFIAAISRSFVIGAWFAARCHACSIWYLCVCGGSG